MAIEQGFHEKDDAEAAWIGWMSLLAIGPNSDGIKILRSRSPNTHVIDFVNLKLSGRDSGLLPSSTSGVSYYCKSALNIL